MIIILILLLLYYYYIIIIFILFFLVPSVLIILRVKNIKLTTDWSGYSSWPVSASKVPLNATSLNFCIRILEMRWKRKKDSLGSSEIVERCLPSSNKNECPASLIGPSVSLPIGTNRCDAGRPAYFETFLSAAACAARCLWPGRWRRQRKVPTCLLQWRSRPSSGHPALALV